jgi:hypothetical protein
MLEEGRFASVRELAEAERVSLSYVSHILRLTLLAPEIVEWTMDGRWAPQLSQLMLPFPQSGRGNASGSSNDLRMVTGCVSPGQGVSLSWTMQGLFSTV